MTMDIASWLYYPMAVGALVVVFCCWRICLYEDRRSNLEKYQEDLIRHTISPARRCRRFWRSLPLQVTTGKGK